MKRSLNHTRRISSFLLQNRTFLPFIMCCVKKDKVLIKSGEMFTARDLCKSLFGICDCDIQKYINKPNTDDESQQFLDKITGRIR